MANAWPIVTLGRVLQQRKEFVGVDDLQTYKRCRVQLHAQGVVIRDVVTGAQIKTKKQQVCRAGEFLVAEIDAKVGGFGIVPSELDGAIVSSHYFLFQIDGNQLHPEFLNYLIRTPSFRDQVSAQGSTNYAAIRPDNVLGYTLPLPPVAEQRRIVARIEEVAARVDEARTLRRQAAEEAEALTHARARLILSEIAEQLTLLADWLHPSREGILTGPFGTQLRNTEFTDSGVPLLTIGNIQYGGLDTHELKHVSPSKADQLSRYRVCEGDILFARMGTVGRCCVVPRQSDGWLINYHIIRVALDTSRVEPRFIHWTIQASGDIESYLDDKIRGATREGVNSKIVAALPCRVPPLPEQRRIVTELDALQAEVDRLKALQAETATKLNALLPSVLERAFRGEL